MNKLQILALLCMITLASCSQQQARQPISHSSGTFMKESIERNKKLVAGEEQKIDSLIKSDPSNKYIASQKGYWYYYQQRNTTDSLTPKRGDIAYFDYEIKDLNGNIIYSQLELRPQEYYVDKEQKIMMGLRDGIKLMRKNETVTFLFPSHMAYGYHGDERRIGQNEPLICTVTLRDFKPEPKTSEE
ncbi:MAG TPA: gliding motility-associated peptidyl-prolyl isomerase GldI [Flavobacterium sp.]|jgi:gliding motility-associated peptidyl-prolyl isomerase|nr:gliding motility-associated peptidyl-prolyl isomerase GldI [Flavobacterium sp.]